MSLAKEASEAVSELARSKAEALAERSQMLAKGLQAETELREGVGTENVVAREGWKAGPIGVRGKQKLRRRKVRIGVRTPMRSVLTGKENP